MIDNETHDLVRQLTDGLMTMIPLEQRLAVIMRTLDHADLTELAYLMEDSINRDRRKPADAGTSLRRIEQYIGERVRQANWRVKHDDLMAELREIQELRYELMDSYGDEAELFPDPDPDDEFEDLEPDDYDGPF